MKQFIFSIAFVLGGISAQGVVTQLDKGSINYSEQSITAIGSGLFPQCGQRWTSAPNGITHSKTRRHAAVN
ncbi:MAG: hypothetical protein Ct9H90mP20_6090 [Candidatus Neomarinimicrobiota bacterium]|nr:MAG: hypothetical protein Ct9H90mP20_6090 [Candidatus Neomarinimicrobiota bacterium]